MTVGFIMLCHTALDRAAEVARFWAAAGCPVVIHLDRRVVRAEREAFARRVADLEIVSFSRRYACEWGTWSLVAATQAAATQLLARHADVGHVFLSSGACLPLRPAEELIAYLAHRPRTDFIESVTTADVGWTVGGLSEERFTFHFPFPWRKRRALFDLATNLQRRVGIRRRVPEGLVPHLGSQWWCLSRRTLSAILEDPDRPLYDRYFRRVWIPDESYFQTLCRLHATEIESRSLTLSKFGAQGKPHVFYDDHLQLLRRSDCFVARKIWPHANRLYAEFLSPANAAAIRAEPNPGKIDRIFSKAVERRLRGRPGLYMQSRFPRTDRENGKTCAAYSVFHGFADLFEDFGTWLSRAIGGRVHGHLFAPGSVEFAGRAAVFNGALSDSAALRDYNPRAFLTNLLWATRGERQCFMFGPRDLQDLNAFVAGDPNAQVSVITGTWAIPLWRQAGDFGTIRKEAARLQRIETEHLALLRSSEIKARVRIWQMAEFVENPMEPLQIIVDEIVPRAARRLVEAPRMADLTGFGLFLQRLKNEGMQPTLVGDFTTVGLAPEASEGGRRGRPYLVR